MTFDLNINLISLEWVKSVFLDLIILGFGKIVYLILYGIWLI